MEQMKDKILNCRFYGVVSMKDNCEYCYRVNFCNKVQVKK